MVGLVAMTIFTGALALALAVIWSMVAPQWRRIANVVSGEADRPFRPLADLALTEQRIAVRCRVVAPVHGAATRYGAAA